MAICRKEFSDRMAEIGGITKKSALQATDLFMEAIKDYLSEGERIMFTGFGREKRQEPTYRRGMYCARAYACAFSSQ